MDEIDKLLADLASTPSSPPPTKPIPPLAQESVENLLGRLDESTTHNVRQHLSISLPIAPDRPPMNDLLIQVKAEQDGKLQAEQLRQQELEFEQKRQEKLKAQRLQELKAQRREELRPVAQQWLKQLKPKSNEGRWFEEFVCNYESRLEAAIEYLEALDDLDHLR